MPEFTYLLEKIRDASFVLDPFPHLYVKDFLSPEHFAAVVEHGQVRQDAPDTHELILRMQGADYEPVAFPGCTADVKDYLDPLFLPSTNGTTSGFGMAWRLKRFYVGGGYTLNNLMDYMNGGSFAFALHGKFDLPTDTRGETHLQKYLSGYEISPHPDVRSKALTYMLNVNPAGYVDTMDWGKARHLYCRLMRFKPEHAHISQFWADNPDTDRCWVPWDWCDTAFTHRANNSLLMFAPGNDSLHAIKLDYDHTVSQRTQIYGNIWQRQPEKLKPCTWRDLPVEVKHAQG